MLKHDIGVLLVRASEGPRVGPGLGMARDSVVGVSTSQKCAINNPSRTCGKHLQRYCNFTLSDTEISP